MPHYKLWLEYEGSAFAGWQEQAQGELTVQGALRDALERIVGERPRVTGAGRTDAGVHAAGQVASLSLVEKKRARTFSPDELQRAINGVVPAAMAVVRLEVADEAFDARRDALGKHYRYRIWNGSLRSPLRAARAHAVAGRLDLSAMQEAADALCGRHDFACFQAAGTSVVQTVRDLWRLEWVGSAGGELSLEVEGSGFLRHMVRNIAGTLIEVGMGKRPAHSMEALLAARDRSRAGPTAPAHGLTLERVYYRGEAGLPEFIESAAGTPT